MWPFKSGIIKVVVTYGFEGQAAINVHFVLQNAPQSPIPDGTLLNAANAFRTAFDTNWKTQASAEWDIDAITALDYSREGGNEVATNLALPIVGLVAGNAIPGNCAVVVSQRTPRTGRSYRGRNFVPGLSVGTVQENTANASLMAAWSLTYSDLRTGLNAVNLNHVVYSLYADNAPRVTPEATLITGTIVNSQVDTQRRRMPPMA